MTLGRGLASVLAIGACACSHSLALTARMQEVQETLTSAEEKGAMRCAPRELAVARSEIEFARLCESQGQETEAWAHLAVAQPNAHAADALSAAESCKSASAVR